MLAVVAAALLVRFRWYRLGRDLSRPEVLPPLGSLVLAAGMFFFGIVGAQVAVRVAGLSLTEAASSTVLADQARIMLGAVAGQALVACVYVARLRGLRRPARYRRARRGRAALLAIVCLALAWPMVNAAGFATAAIVELLGGPPPAAVAHDTLRAILDSPRDGWFVLTAVIVLLATPALEELLYRGLIQETFRRIGLGPWTSIVLTSGGFAAMHVGNSAPHAVAGLFVLSLAFGWAFERTGRLTAPIVMHVLFNAGNLVLALAMHQRSALLH